MTNDLKLVPGHLTRFCRQQYPALGWRAGRAASRPHGGHSILFLFLLLPFSSSFSSLLPAHSGSNSPREAAARSGGQEAATDGKTTQASHLSRQFMDPASFPGLSPSPSFSFNHLSTLTLFIQNCFQKAKASLAKKMKVV